MKSREKIQAIVNKEVSFIETCGGTSTLKGIQLLAFLKGISEFATDSEYLIASELINNIIKEKNW